MLKPVGAGIFHHNRVQIRGDGNLVWLDGAKNPVMIASNTDLRDEMRAIVVGIPFGQTK